MSERARRAATNEVSFRQLNERIVGALDRFGAGHQQFQIVCECSDAACAAMIPISLEEYRRGRELETTFLVRPGHVEHAVEDVRVEAEGFWIVEKIGEAGRIAKDSSPA